MSTRPPVVERSLAARPPVVERALEVFAAEAKRAGVVVDVEQSPFASLEKLRAVPPEAGASSRARGLSLGLAALLGERIVKRFDAFWFPQREHALGAVGFPHAMLAIDPLALVDAALQKGSLAELDARVRELEWTLKGMTPAASALGPDGYRELFDPGLVQFLVVDTGVAERAHALDPQRAATALDEALREAELDPAVRESLQRAWLTSLTEPRALELFVRMASAVASGAPADESFWADIAFRLLPATTTTATTTTTGPAPGPRVLGVFDPARVRPVLDVKPDDDTRRLFFVDAADLGSRLDDVERSARGDIVDLARERLVELRALVRQVSPVRSLAFRRMTVSEAANEAATASVSRVVAELAREW